MKNLLLLLMILPLFLTSCEKDDDTPSCDTSDVAAVIVGVWKESPLNGIGDEVTFESDMTGSCTSESLFETELNGDKSNTFTWSLNTDNSAITLKYPNGLSPTYNILSVACDKISFELFGITVVLSRK